MYHRVRRLLVLLAVVMLGSLLLLGASGPARAAQTTGDACRLPPPVDGFVIHSGFPLHPAVPATTGTYKAVVLFVDFADRSATLTPQATFEAAWPGAEEYIESLSHGQLDFVVEPHLEWLTFAANEAAYSLGAGGSDARTLLADAIALADPVVDFGEADSVWVLSPRDRLSGEAWQSGHPTLDLVVDGGHRLKSAVIAGLTETPLPQGWTFNPLMSHEVIHTLGLPDLYDWERDRQVPPEEAHRFVGNFSHMGTTSGVSGQLGFYSLFNGNELFVWERWQLGWVSDDQINCTSAPSITRELSPAALQDGDKAITIRTGATTALVVEARAKLRWDADMDRAGVLVYTVDTSINSGDGPLRVQGSFDGLWADSSVLLQPGESLRVGEHVVQVNAAVDDGFDVRVYQLRCQGRLVSIDMNQNGGDGTGTAGRDVILGTPEADEIRAGGGNDIVCGGGGNDTIYGNTGPDILAGEAGHDTIYGGAGDDTIHGNRGNDMLFGEGGADRIFGYAHNDLIDGGDGNDRLHGNFGDDTINAGAGDDRVFGYGDNDMIDLGPGNDLAGGNFGDDTIRGGDGDDVIYGSDGSDTVHGGAGNDDLSGNSGTDALFGETGDDTLDGGINTDSCDGGDDTDTAVRCESVVDVP